MANQLTQTQFPSVDAISEAVPAGRVPYLTADKLLQESRTTDRGPISRFEFLGAAISTIADANEDGTLQPPLPEGLASHVAAATDSISDINSGDLPLSEIRQRQEDSIAAADYLVAAVVDFSRDPFPYMGTTEYLGGTQE